MSLICYKLCGFRDFGLLQFQLLSGPEKLETLEIIKVKRPCSPPIYYLIFLCFLLLTCGYDCFIIWVKHFLLRLWNLKYPPPTSSPDIFRWHIYWCLWVCVIWCSLIEFKGGGGGGSWREAATAGLHPVSLWVCVSVCECVCVSVCVCVWICSNTSKTMG